MRENIRRVLRISATTTLFLIKLNISLAEDIDLEKIVVTPSRIEEPYGESGRKVNIISSRKLNYLHPKNFSEALYNISSLYISDFGSLGALKTIQMRGSTSSQVLVLLDGRPINSPRTGLINLSTIPFENIQRIEVLHGPASSMYGSSAMGGVVNIITKEPPRKGQKIELMSSFGTFRTYEEQFSYGARIKNFAYRLDTAYQSSEGHRDNAEFNAKDANCKLTYEFNSDNKLEFRTGFYKDKLGTPGSILSPDLNDKQLDRKNFFDISWNVKPRVDKDIEVSTRAYQDYDRLEFIETPDPLVKSTHTTKVRGVNLKLNQGVWQAYRLIYGFDWVGNYNDSTKTAKHEYIVRAGYIENRLELGQNLNVNFGVRLDDYSNFGTEISPSANFVYKFKNDARCNFLIARSFRAPTFNDLYWPATGFEEGNPNLQPEKGITTEFGVEKKFSKFLKIGLTYFRSDYDRLIKWQVDSDNIWRPKNIDSAIVQGVEQELQINPFDNLDIDIGYTFLRAKNDKTGKYLTYQPQHKANLSLLYKGFAGFIFGLKGEFVNRRFHNATNTIYVKRYYILGIKLSKNINKNLNLFFNIDNLLNKRYQNRRNYPMPGFSLMSGMKLEF
jgi:outer membrane receptor for ferrienterochelin and colicins